MDQAVPDLQLAWARLRVDVDCGLRRGTCYRVTRFTPSEVLHDVRHCPIAIPRHWLDVVFGQPHRLSVVRRAASSRANRTRSRRPRRNSSDVSCGIAALLALTIVVVPVWRWLRHPPSFGSPIMGLSTKLHKMHSAAVQPKTVCPTRDTRATPGRRRAT